METFIFIKNSITFFNGNMQHNLHRHKKQIGINSDCYLNIAYSVSLESYSDWVYVDGKHCFILSS